ncbi:hypothetical protein CBS101457_004235 [Exobasidium rhododendri]|nr:hypothetical protein CBS101457_004235 [Exobasidium rhododendri]
MWLSGSSSSLVTRKVQEGEGSQMGGRKYHISAESSQHNSAPPSDIHLITMKQSGSGEVDLDLSFDFVSGMQKGRPIHTPDANDENVDPITAPVSGTRKGMSTARWASRAKKQPPSALLLHNQVKSKHLNISSQFSPISPLVNKDDNMQPLVATPLSASRRANDAGIQPPQPVVSKPELIIQQRLAARQKQDGERQSPQKIKRKTPKGVASKDETEQSINSSPSRKAVLGENKNKTNARILPSTEQGDVFDDAAYDYKVHLKKTTSVASMRTGGAVSSFATAAESQGAKTKKGRLQKGSIESMNTFDTARSAETKEVPAMAAESLVPNYNMLGLNLVKPAAPLGHGTLLSAELGSSPPDTQHSSPETPFSPLFSESGASKDSEHTRANSSAGAQTPGTAISSIFDERSLDYKVADSTLMARGSTASVLKDVIVEEGESVSQVDAALTTSHSADLAEAQNEDPTPRSRQETETSTSDFGNSPIRKGQKMIVSTTNGSPTEEVEFLFRKPNRPILLSEDTRQLSGARVGPWPQSPLLLTNFLQGEISDESKGALGLGITIGRPEEPHMQVDMSELSKDQALASQANEAMAGVDLGRQAMNADISTQSINVVVAQEMSLVAPPLQKGAQLGTSPSFVSSLEGFAINVTHPIQISDKTSHGIEIGVEEDLSSRNPSQSKGRWSSKLWDLAVKSPFPSLKSPSRSKFEQERISSLKTLTLVSKKVEEEGGVSGKGSKTSRSHPGGEARDQVHLRINDSDYRAVPSSAPLPAAATFTSLQAPSPALYSESRSSRHVKQTSRLRYLSHLDQVQVDMGASPPLAQHAPSESLATPKTAQHLSGGLTPKMEFIEHSKTNRHSWCYSTTSVDQDGNGSRMPSWLAPKRKSLTFHRDSKLFATLRNSTLSAVEPEQQMKHVPSEHHQAVEIIAEDGVRRRGNHRAANSDPSTPTVLPDIWIQPARKADHIPYGAVYDGRDTAIRFQQATPASPHYQDAPRHRRKVLSTISILGPASAIITPYLANLTGSRNRNKMVRSIQSNDRVKSKNLNRLSLFTNNRGGPEGFFAYSGRALENTSPSRALFFAGFLAMPWLWFIGGWGLNVDGSMYVEKEIYWGESDQDAVLQQLLQKEPVGSLLHPTTRRGSAQPLSSNRRGPARTMVQDRLDEYDNENYRYSMGRPESIIDMEMDSDQPREAGRLHSIELQGEDDQRLGIAYSTEGNTVGYPLFDASQGNASALPPSQWNLHEDSMPTEQQQPSRQPQSFLQRVRSQVNTRRFTTLKRKNDNVTSAPSSRSSTSSYSLSTMLRKKELQNQSQGRLDTSNDAYNDQQLSKKATVSSHYITNWTKLEKYVLWNRIMASLISIVIFGGFAVAILAVVKDW